MVTGWEWEYQTGCMQEVDGRYVSQDLIQDRTLPLHRSDPITQIVPHGHNAFHTAQSTASQPLVYIASLPRALLSGNGSTGLLSDQPFVARGRKRDVGQTSLAL